MPLLKSEQTPVVVESKETIVSFVGKILSNRRDVVRTVQENMGDREFVRYRGNDWQNTLGRSHFALTPRGYGRTSFNVYESIQLGVIPIYVWDDVEWLPYRGSDNADWDSFAISVNARDVSKIPKMLKRLLEDEDVEDKQKRLKELRESHFTYRGVIDQIAKFMIGGEALSDLRCIAMPSSAGVLSYGEGLEGVFGVLDTSGDNLVSFPEFYSTFKEFQVQSVSEPGVKIIARFSEKEGRELWNIMDVDRDDQIDYEEWMSKYPQANARMKEIILEHEKNKGT